MRRTSWKAQDLVQLSMMLFRRLGVVLIAFCGVAGAHEPERARHAMVVTEEALAADVGLSTLRGGGNAVDAAVSIGFTLAVTHPFAGNLGGGGFMLIRFADGRSTFIDFRERAPEKATRDMYLDATGKPTRESIEGWRSSGVPGTVRGFELAQSKYGKRKWSELVLPARDLAAKGFPLNYLLAESLRTNRRLAADPESKRLFVRDGKPYEPGEVLKQPELADTLDRIAKMGSKDFYEGETARRFSEEMARHGGLITLADLKNYQAVERSPITGTYRNYTVIAAPPPSAGGVGLLYMLGLLDGSGYEKSGAGSAATYHYLAEVMRRFYADRNKFLGDPDFVKNPIAGLLDPSYLQKRRSMIDLNHATPSVGVQPGNPAGGEGTETVHYNVVDTEGNAVAVTYTLNDGFGNGITVPGLGFLLNDEMDDFSVRPGQQNLFGIVQGKVNAIEPRKRPLSSMSPTIILRDGKLLMLLGTPGGSRITTAVLQVFLNVADFGMNIQDAVDFPRIHHQWQPDRLFVDRGVSPDTIAALKARGHQVDDAPGTVPPRVGAILIDNGWLQGAVDGRNTRNVSKAAGY
jgi:gamma-glutamyltranspeptidase / glutathione hydrolase